MSDNQEPTRSQVFTAALIQGLMFSFVEVIFLVLFTGFSLFGEGVIPSLLLWTSFIIAAVWVLVMCTRDSHIECKALVLDRWVFMTDFIISASLLVILAVLVWSYDWWFSTMLLIAASQNLRYTWLSLTWLMAERLEQRQSKDDNVP